MQKILDVKVDWHLGWANSPHFEVLLSPATEETRFEVRGPAYLGLNGEYAEFLSYTGPGKGFGGQVFNLLMKDGSRKELKGPWSGNSDFINTHFPEVLVVEAHTTTSRTTFEKGYTFGSSAVTVQGLLRYWAEQADTEWGMALVRRNYGVWVEPTKGPFIKSSHRELLEVLAMLGHVRDAADRAREAHFFYSELLEFFKKNPDQGH